MKNVPKKKILKKEKMRNKKRTVKQGNLATLVKCGVMINSFKALKIQNCENL